MILVDSRIGSVNLLGEIKKHGIGCEVTTLACGDFAFEGNGPNGDRISIGIERKEIRDLASCMIDHRFAHKQAIPMQQTYDRCYLMVEGQWRPGVHGELEIFTRVGGGRFVRKEGWTASFKGPRGINYINLHNYLVSIAEFSKFRVITSYNLAMTAYQIACLYQFWNKRYEAHTSNSMVFHDPVMMIAKPSFERMAASCMPGVGTKLSAEVVKRFRTVYNMVTADAATWASVPGIGAVKAGRIYKAIRGMKQ